MEQIGGIRLDDSFYSGQDFYCDGEVEDELLEIVRKYPESEYRHIIAKRKKWPILYHLSPVRENILSWYPFDRNANILEVGSGCGAVTGCIAEKAEKLTCVDLSKKRSLINAYRHKDLNNVTIMLGNFEDIEKALPSDYDYITLIGVLEYAASYIHSEHPYRDFLAMIYAHLKPGGEILVAIENKLGMKYWAGCQEDHLGGYFTGIQGYPQNPGVQTFSKKELEDMIKEIGCTEYTFYYPYPDYKFPLSIYSDNYLPHMGDLNSNIRNFDMDRIVLFDECKAFDGVIASGQFPEFSNSYFVSVKKG